MHRTPIPISPHGPMEECDTDPHQVPNSDILWGKEEIEFKTGSQKDPGALTRPLVKTSSDMGAKPMLREL